MLVIWIIIGVVVLFILAMVDLFFDPVIPPGYAKPNRLRAANFVARVVHYWCLFRWQFGGNYTGHQRAVQEFVSKFARKPKAVTITKSLKIVNTKIADVRVRIYGPKDDTDHRRPGVIYYHGGGWCLGNLDGYDAVCGRIAKDLKAVVISVDYRLAHMDEGIKYPIPLDDCAAVTKEVLSHASDYAIDTNRIALAGDSAGGNLAAAVSVRLHKENFPFRPKLQVLIYPVLQFLDFVLPSYQQNAFGPILTRQGAGFFTALYATGDENKKDHLIDNRYLPEKYESTMELANLDEKICFEAGHVPFKRAPTWAHSMGKFEDTLLDPCLSPLLADDVTCFPRTYIFSAQYDVLRDDSFLFAKRLRNAGVEVTHVNNELAIHGFISMFRLLPEAEKCMQDMTDFMKSAL